MSSRRPPCKFFQQGKCRNGNRCQFPHVYENNNNNNNTNNSNNSNSGFNSNNANSYKQEVERFANSNSLDAREKELKDTLSSVPEIEISIVTSSMGFGYPATENLIQGRDYSFEESRWDFYQAQQQGLVPQYEQQMNVRDQDMKLCIEEIRKETRKASRYSQIAAQQKLNDPNQYIKPFLSRPLDLSGGNLAGVGTAPAPFGTQPMSSGNVFGSQTSSPFGSTNTASTPFGTQTQGQAASSGFGSTPSMSTGTGAFGTQSMKPASSSLSPAPAFGSAGFGTTPFGSSAINTAAPAAPSGFGTSGFGSSSLGGATSGTSTAPSTFGTTNNTPAFGTSAFGSSLNANTTGTSAFGSSGFGTSGFGARAPAATTANATNTTIVPAVSAFGSSGFGSSGFGTAPAIGSSPFGALTGNNPASATTTSSPFGSAGTPFGQQPTNTPATSAFGSFGANNASSSLSSNTGFGSMFGGANATNNNKPSGNFQPRLKQSDHEPVRIDPKELSDVVKTQFEAMEFTLGMVPEIEPPLVFC